MFDDQVRNFQKLPIADGASARQREHLRYEDCSFWDYLEEIKQITRIDERLSEDFTRYAENKEVYPMVCLFVKCVPTECLYLFQFCYQPSFQAEPKIGPSTLREFRGPIEQYSVVGCRRRGQFHAANEQKMQASKQLIRPFERKYAVSAGMSDCWHLGAFLRVSD